MAGGKNKMMYNQKRDAARATFAFGKTELSYSFRCGRTDHRIAADYVQFDRARKHAARRDWARFRLGVLLSFAGFGAVIAQGIFFGVSSWLTLWVMPGLFVLALFIVSQSHFVVLHAGDDPVWVIEGASSRKVIAEIDRRRRDRIAELYGPLNLANEPYLEIRKIEWLVLESVLTREAADSQIAMVETHVARKAAAIESATNRDNAGMFAREALAI